jgi:phospholipase/carboxylesterase
MNVRFSSQSVPQSCHSANRSDTDFDDFVPGLLPSAGCEALLLDTPDSPVNTDAPPVDADELFVPDHYEPNYAYPLLVWLAPPTGLNGRLQRLMRRISERNYFGVSVAVHDPERIEEELFETFVGLRRRYRLHTERVYLLGSGTSGTQALLTGLSQPAWFGGIAAFSARWPETPRLLAQYDELRGKRVLLGIDDADNPPIVSDALYMQQLLWSAGMHVTALSASVGREPGPSLLREIDRWIMQAVEQPELVC